MKKIFLVLGSLGILLGVICRAILLTVSFEYDELFTAVTANPAVPLSYIWNHYLMVDVHPPLHNVLLWLLNHIVPYGPEWILRFPSFILSLVGLFLAWKLFPRYLPRLTRWLFMLLLSCNFYLLLYAQHARAYSLMFCLSVALTFLYLQIARCIRYKQPIPKKCWIWYAICSLLLCWSHYFGALLFGSLSVVLFAYAWKSKQPLRMFVLVPLLVLVGFTPWLIPNLLQNIYQQRFAGNWWANTSLSWGLIISWGDFFFSSRKTFYMFVGFGVAAIAYSLLRFKRQRVWPFGREILLVFIPMAIAGTFALLVSLKIFWLIWRYFIPFVPCLYLFVALILTPLCKRYRVAGLVFLCLAGLSFHAFIRTYSYFQEGYAFTARDAMRVYQNAFADKDLYVAAAEAFPIEAMQPMYAFYPNQYFHSNARVYELLHMEPEQREQLLAREDQFVMWMPNCEPKKMYKLAQTFQRNMSIFTNFHRTCFILPAGPDRRTVDPDKQHEYIQRIKQYVQQVEKTKATKN